jgi:hypothetical protein
MRVVSTPCIRPRLSRASAGQSVRIHTGSGTDTSTNLYWGSGYYIWNNDADGAYLRSDLGYSVDSCGWAGGGTYRNC